MENYKKYIYIYIKIFESIYKDRKNYEVWWYWNPKTKIHQHKGAISKKYIYIDINKIVVSNKVLLGKKGFKYFIGYKDASKMKPLFIFLPKMSAYRKDFDITKYTSFLIKDDELLEKYNEIWEKVKNSLKKNFDSEPVYNEKYLK